MQQKKTGFFHGGISAKDTTYLLLSVSGLGFWFLLGFPFYNHNESYRWLPVLARVSLWDTLTKQVISIESFRPLGVANAWLTYRISGNIYLQQIQNWLFALSSFGVLFAAAKNKMLFSWLSFLASAGFFSGYIYLFHLHGVFYGPFQVYFSVLAVIAWRHRQLSDKMLIATSMATLIICLYHTFALFTFCAFLVGYLLQIKRSDKPTAFLKIGLVLLATISLAAIFLHAKELKPIQVQADGLLASYELAEINMPLTIIAAALSVWAALRLAESVSAKIFAILATLLLSALLVYLKIPVLVLWIGICLFNMIVLRNWVMASLIAASFLLPLGSASGSPTYTIFVIMVCTFVTAEYEQFHFRHPGFFKTVTLFFIMLIFGGLLALKSGIRVPVLSSLAVPILAEQEKTRQLKEIIDWKLNNRAFAQFQLTVFDETDLPVLSKNIIKRINRPVVSQGHLNFYMRFITADSSDVTKKTPLYITFGNKILQDKKIVFSVPGKWNGLACVFQ